MTNRMVISVPDITAREWKTLEDVLVDFKPAEVVEIVHRYCDTQDHAKKYRVNAAQRAKDTKAKYEAAVKAGLIDDQEVARLVNGTRVVLS